MTIPSKLTFLFFICILCGLSAPASAQSFAKWRYPGWTDRYRVEFPKNWKDLPGEVGVVEFIHSFDSRPDPYDIRAIDDRGTTIPVRVLEWTPNRKELQNPGRILCLVALDDLRERGPGVVYLYLGNAKALPNFSAYEWEDSVKLIDGQLPRRCNRHGEWMWEPDPEYGFVHIGENTGSISGNATHSFTGLMPIRVHQSRTRFIQMVWVDPAKAPESISIDLFLNQQTVSAFWSDADALSGISLDKSPSKVGNMPKAGEWVMLTLNTASLKSSSQENLTGLGFSNYGGRVKWGPTYMGTYPLEGKVALHNRQSQSNFGNEVKFTEQELLPIQWDDTLPTGTLQLDIVEVPLFARPDAPLRLTCYVSPSYKYLGELPPRDLNCIAIGADGTETTVTQTRVIFSGGDNWKRVVELPPEQWSQAQRIAIRLMENGHAIAEQHLRLESLGAIKGLASNGNSLEDADGAAVTFVLNRHASVAKNEAGISTATLLLTADLFVHPEDIPAGETVPINSDHPALHLAKRFSSQTLRPSADWVAAASLAASSGAFSRAIIVVDPEITRIGVALHDTGFFLRGIIDLLQDGAGLPVELNYTPLTKEPQTRRQRELLAQCLSVIPLIRNP